MIIRIAKIDDLPFIVAIYNQAVLTKQSTADITPIEVESRRDWFLAHQPDKHPIFIAIIDDRIAGWCSLSAYRPGRMALRYTAEISYYIDNTFQRQGVATALINHAIAVAPQLELKNIFAILLEKNIASLKLLEKLGFQQWGYLPRIADFDGEECGQFYYGLRVPDFS